MIIVGDVHTKKREPYFSAIKNFFEWLFTYDDSFVFLGDLCNSSSPHGDIEDFIAYTFKNVNNEIHVITGNHDISRKQGNSLLHLRQFDNVSVYDDVTETNIEDKSCLILPYKYGNIKEEYEELTGDYDYIFTHITPEACAFGNEGMKLNISGKYIHGHTHMQKDFTDENGNDNIVLGVPLPTRNLEEQQKHRILKLSEGEEQEIEVPQHFTFETLEFGENPQSKNNILNIKNAPSVISVLKEYNDCYIRDGGITIKMNDEDYDLQDNINVNEGIKTVFMEYVKEKELDKDVVDCCLEFL